MSNFTPNIGLPPVNDLMLDNNIKGTPANNYNWINFHTQVANQINSANFYGNQNICLNGDFNFNTGVPLTTTQASGDGAFISELWQIHGASVATYTITHPNYSTYQYNPTGSSSYLLFDVTNYTGNGNNSDFYCYQKFFGLKHLQQFQYRNFSPSCLIYNNLNTALSARFEIYFFYDGTTPAIQKGKNFTLVPGINEISDNIQTEALTAQVVGASPYVEFRLVFGSMTNNQANININYLKYELADSATVLYVDHGLERVRIDNF